MPAPARPRDRSAPAATPLVWVFGATIFLGAFLMFEVELLMGKFVLPWFGGAAAVWTTCLVFYQLLLLAGYGYAHLLSRWHTRVQVRVHVALVIISLAFLAAHAFLWPSPITPGEPFIPHADHPIQNITLLLATSIGLPFFLLAATGPLLQRWFADRNQSTKTYRFYAVSNVGSLLGVISHPLLIEPYLGLSPEGRIWAAGYLAFAIGSIWCARTARRSAAPVIERVAVQPSDGMDAEAVRGRWLWFGLAACASVVLMATTSALSEAVTSVPLLWMLLLGFYLLSFVVTFAGREFYRRGWAHPVLGVTLFVAYVALSPWSVLLPAVDTIVIYTAIVFVTGLVCHGELARLAPPTRHLTSFYLVIAAGGAAGGVISTLIAPVFFVDYWELYLGLSASAILTAIVLFRDRTSWIHASEAWRPLVLWGIVIIVPGRMALALVVPSGFHVTTWQYGGFLALGALAIFLWRRGGWMRRLRLNHVAVVTLLVMLVVGLETDMVVHEGDVVAQSRNFYGVLTVRERDRETAHDSYALLYGVTMHGMQYRDSARRREPTTYYGANTGIALALEHHPRRTAPTPQSLRVGVVGLGVGTIAAYAHPGDSIRFYELNPEVIRLSKGDDPFFTFAQGSAGTVEFVPGDARVSLAAERERIGRQRFDILVLDAFQGDAVPIHLLTRDAFALYLDHLRDSDGIIAINTSNRFLDFEPEIATVAEYLGLTGMMVFARDRGEGVVPSHWILLSRNPASFAHPSFAEAGRRLTNARIPLWTDQHSNILAVLR